jgi:deoxycytidine triphosphate deaminase
MILSAKKILELNEKYKIIENLSERELNPEGVGIDVRVGEVYKIKGKVEEFANADVASAK